MGRTLKLRQGPATPGSMGAVGGAQPANRPIQSVGQKERYKVEGFPVHRSLDRHHHADFPGSKIYDTVALAEKL